ncbi:MAG: CBS domain-containing protein [Acidobacteriota bacterium]
MSVKIDRLMAQGVVVAQPDHSVHYVRRQMKTLDIHAVPVADASGAPVGIVRSRDLINVTDPQTPVEQVMEKDPLTVDRHFDVSAAAALMRRHRQRQVIVTEHGKIAGIVSAFDFLELLEGRRFEEREAQEFRTGIFHIGELPEPPTET